MVFVALGALLFLFGIRRLHIFRSRGEARWRTLELSLPAALSRKGFLLRQHPSYGDDVQHERTANQLPRSSHPNPLLVDCPT